MQLINQTLQKVIKMKNIVIVIAALIFVPMVSFSQSDNMKELFTSYENIADFKLTTSNNNSDINLGLDSDIEKLFNNIKEIYVIKYTGKDLNSQKLKTFQNNLNTLIQKGDYSPMVEVSGDGVLKILLKRNGNSDPSEVVLVKEDENSALYLWASE